MSSRIPIPRHLASRGFDRREAEAAGLTQGRLRRKDVLRPFHGVQTVWLPRSTAERCHAYAVKLKPGQFFSHSTAAQLLGLPLPTAYEAEQVIHVGAVRPADPPHSRGVQGHRLVAAADPVLVDGMPVADALDTFCQLAADLAYEDLVVVADHLLNLVTLPEEEAKALMLDRIGALRRIGGAKLVRAVGAARRGSRSPAETRIRLVLESAGVPRAELNAPIEESGTGRYLGSPDFVWRSARVVLEYEGDQHRTDQRQFRYDIVRYDDLTEDGWRVLRATGDDLTKEGRRRLVLRVRRALQS